MIRYVLPLFTAALLGQTPAPAQPPKIYNETADARVAIANAIKRAATDDIRVLINWGANDNAQSAKLSDALRGVESTLFADEYTRAYVDVGHADKNLDIARTYGVTLSAENLPALTILDAKGKVVANASARDFLSGGAFAPASISSFLKKNQASQPNDTANFENAVKQAKRDGKVVFVWFSAPW